MYLLPIMALYLYLLLSLATWLLTLTRHTSAQGCWRETPCSGLGEAVYAGEWDANNFAPESRNVAPLAIYSLQSGQKIATWPQVFTINSGDSDIYLDFGKEVGGIVTVEYSVSSVTESGSLGLAFSEARNWVGRSSDSSNGNYARPDGAIYSTFSYTGNFTYVMPLENLRGGFRYLTLFLSGDGVTVTIRNLDLELSFQPTWPNLRAYQGYFHSNDDLLNKIWYSGAYTLQVDAIDPSTGRSWPPPSTAWQNNGLLGPGNTINVDGAKRDRTVWPGDMGVAGPASFYSTGDLESIKNSLQSLYDIQADSGLLPFSGRPVNASGSNTYHMWTMIGLYNYILYSGDVEFLKVYWEKHIFAMGLVLDQIDPSVGLMDITRYPNDWGRFNSDGYLASAQMLAYHTLTTGATLATWVGDTTGLNDFWFQNASKLRDAISEKLWDAQVGAFKDNYGTYDTGLHPQDGNSLAVVLGVVDGTGNEAQAISSWLTKNWMSIGPESPELPGEVSPFITSFEIQAHLLARQPQRALDLIRTSWGWYLNNENGTQSTMIEGYLTDGTFGYRHNAGYDENYSYTSHAHGWSTGPITALTEHALGLSVTGLAGMTCLFAPQIGDLKDVQGGFVTRLGKYRAELHLNETTGCILAEVEIPEEATKEVILPPSCKTNRSSRVLVNGEEVDVNGIDIVDGPGGAMLYSMKLPGGKHTIEY
ncbi:glycoside hydrolase family 78 [Xylaria hypoxylon]|uniref:Glycoside hydrolase family 78 n=1 Tax=Xylaria hypoxylon TaxID=37992 RepID=A0A4Z0Z8Q9_9PEZI|nr:glycoside hydrolase family 78 [Xylaria hypoxylon]